MFIGSYEQLQGQFPLYILQFSRRGELKSSQTAAQLLAEIKRGAYSDIYLFSHGWNNHFGDATRMYRSFFELFLSLRPKYLPNRAYRPVFVGLHWPSIILNLPWESGPRFAADGAEDGIHDAFARAKDSVADELDEEKRKRFYELTEASVLNEGEASELAAILLPIYTANALDAEQPATKLTADGLIAAWNSVPGEHRVAPPDYGRQGRIRDEGDEQPPRAANLADFLDPRNALRVTTVLLMKDRAGLVGRTLAPLLEQLCAPEVPVRMIGHSYGARVCLTALSAPFGSRYRVASLLLLQPAVNQYCFAASVPGLGLMTQGGFVPALDRIGQPVYLTFSSSDIPLHALFHLAARRVEDRGEIRYAAEGPSEFSALGGYGPAGLPPSDYKEERIHRAGQPYEIPAGVRVLALDGSAGEIPGHGQIVSEHTCWALIDQESRTWNSPR